MLFTRRMLMTHLPSSYVSANAFTPADPLILSLQLCGCCPELLVDTHAAPCNEIQETRAMQYFDADFKPDTTLNDARCEVYCGPIAFKSLHIEEETSTARNDWLWSDKGSTAVPGFQQRLPEFGINSRTQRFRYRRGSP